MVNISPRRHPGLAAKRVGSATIVNLGERPLTEGQTIEQLATDLLQLVEQHGPGALVLNCCGLVEFGSALVGKLVWLRKRMQSLGDLLVLTDLPQHFADVLNRLRLAPLFTRCASEEEAVRMFAG
jgi:anti-anti-sigma regulatory factor